MLRERLADPGFLNNQGLGNEVGIYTFCYDAALEPEARDLVAHCVSDSESGVLPCSIHVCNLYDAFLNICRERRILDRIPQQEEKRGKAGLEKQLKKIATPEAFAKAMEYQPHAPGDVLFITGVGEVYPFVRAHNILDNIQHIFFDVPVILFYPGKFTGTSLSLFGKLEDGNYYRAFDLI